MQGSVASHRWRLRQELEPRPRPFWMSDETSAQVGSAARRMGMDAQRQEWCRFGCWRGARSAPGLATGVQISIRVVVVVVPKYFKYAAQGERWYGCSEQGAANESWAQKDGGAACQLVRHAVRVRRRRRASFCWWWWWYWPVNQTAHTR